MWKSNLLSKFQKFSNFSLWKPVFEPQKYDWARLENLDKKLDIHTFIPYRRLTLDCDWSCTIIALSWVAGHENDTLVLCVAAGVVVRPGSNISSSQILFGGPRHHLPALLVCNLGFVRNWFMHQKIARGGSLTPSSHDCIIMSQPPKPLCSVFALTLATRENYIYWENIIKLKLSWWRSRRLRQRVVWRYAFKFPAQLKPLGNSL